MTRDLCQTLTEISEDIWNRIRFCREKSRYIIHETTITQNLIYELYNNSDRFSLPLKIFESTKENVNGNDLEIFIEIDSGDMVCFSVQAKIIYNTLKYPAIKHKVNGRSQIDLLISHSLKCGTIPLYMFYNYFPDSEILKDVLDLEPKQCGCTLVNASHIKRDYTNTDPATRQLRWNRTPDFLLVHFLLPFISLQTLACKFVGSKSEDIVDIFEEKELKLTTFRKNDLLDNNIWRNLSEAFGIGFIPFSNEVEYSDMATVNKAPNSPFFNPRYRVMFLKNSERRSISTLS